MRCLSTQFLEESNSVKCCSFRCSYSPWTVRPSVRLARHLPNRRIKHRRQSSRAEIRRFLLLGSPPCPRDGFCVAIATETDTISASMASYTCVLRGGGRTGSCYGNAATLIRRPLLWRRVAFATVEDGWSKDDPTSSIRGDNRVAADFDGISPATCRTMAPRSAANSRPIGTDQGPS
jgi:hypothetical protein